MADVATLLQSLRPLREPPPIASVLPYIDMLLAGVTCAAVAFFLVAGLKRTRAGLRRTAEAALAASRLLTPDERLAAQARLLRRLVRVRSGEAAARAQGSAWLAMLDKTFATTFFTQGDGRAFADALYRRGPAADLDGIDTRLAALFARMPAGTGR